MKTLLGFWYFCNISSILILILARKLLFQRGKHALRDGLEFNMIQRLDQKVNFFITPG